MNLNSYVSWGEEVCLSLLVVSPWLKQLPHLVCRSGAHQVALSLEAGHEAKLHPAALSQDLQPPPELHIPLL